MVSFDGEFLNQNALKVIDLCKALRHLFGANLAIDRRSQYDFVLAAVKHVGFVRRGYCLVNAPQPVMRTCLRVGCFLPGFVFYCNSIFRLSSGIKNEFFCQL